MSDLKRSAFVEAIFQPSLSAASSLLSKEVLPISFSSATDKMSSIANQFFKLPSNHNELSERLEKAIDLERTMLYHPTASHGKSIRDRIDENMTEEIPLEEIEKWSDEQHLEALEKIDEIESNRELRIKTEQFREANRELYEKYGRLK